jgi:hypothetical protein
VHPEKDPGAADQQADDDGRRHDQHAQAPPRLVAREDQRLGQVDGRRGRRMPARQAERVNRHAVWHHLRPRPREQELQALGPEDGADRGGEHEDRERTASCQPEARGGGERDEAEDRVAAECRDVAHGPLEPGGADEHGGIARRAERLQHPLVDRPGVAFEHLVDDLEKAPKQAGADNDGDEEAHLGQARQAVQQRGDVPPTHAA